MALAGNLILAFVVDEEVEACSAYGTHSLLEREALRGEGVIVGEPGNKQIATAHGGLYRFRLTIRGKQPVPV